jgi:transposase InsO family protein
MAFLTDVFSRKIIGWSVSSTLKTEDLPAEALDVAVWNVSDDLTGLVHHSEHGFNCVSLPYTKRIVELGGTPFVSSKGDSYDNALAELQFTLFKTELINKQRPWRTIKLVELATLEWEWWFNNQREHSENGNQPPVEIEQENCTEKRPRASDR